MFNNAIIYCIIEHQATLLLADNCGFSAFIAVSRLVIVSNFCSIRLCMCFQLFTIINKYFMYMNISYIYREDFDDSFNLHFIYVVT